MLCVYTQHCTAGHTHVHALYDTILSLSLSLSLPYRYLVSIGCIKPLCDILTVQDPRIVLVTLEGLENILKVGQIDAKNGVNPYSVLIEEAYG